MLTTLRIKNLALAEDLTIGFQSALTAITGETGAGKSILIGALKLALGERADRGQIRAGSDHCTVEAVFEISPEAGGIRGFMASQGIEEDEEGLLFLKRSFSISGTNRQFINGSPIPLQTLARLGEMLVDLHGPHDHQSLLHSSQQREILDAFGNLVTLRGQFAEMCVQFRNLQAQKLELEGGGEKMSEQADLLRFQAAEIEGARLAAEEEVELAAAHTRVANAAKSLETAQQALGLLVDDDQALLTQAAQLTRSLQELRRIDPEAARLVSLQEDATRLLHELQGELRRYAERIDLNPGRLEVIEERVALIQSLKRKYGKTISEILAFGQEAAAKLARLDGRSEALATIEREQAILQDRLWQAGRELSRQRRALLQRLSKITVSELNALGFKDCRFEVGLISEKDESSPIWNNPAGLDRIEFLFSPNVGEPPRPLSAIASSGEMARVMLALKTALADQDQIPVLVFDEIDANVGGETAAEVGKKMLQIAGKHQVLCITHLAPVAAAAQHHLVVTKRVRENRTITEVTPLDQENRVDEIARMLGGRSRAALDHAQTLLQKR